MNERIFWAMEQVKQMQQNASRPKLCVQAAGAPPTSLRSIEDEPSYGATSESGIVQAKELTAESALCGFGPAVAERWTCKSGQTMMEEKGPRREVPEDPSSDSTPTLSEPVYESEISQSTDR